MSKNIFHYKTPLICNARCEFCSTSSKRSNKKYLIPKKNIIKDFLKIKKMGFRTVIIGGGEPTLIENILDFVKIGNKIGLKTAIITNGFLLDEEIVRKLFEEGLMNICFSIHSDNPKEHDELVGIEGTFENIIKILNLRCYNDKINTNTVIIKNNQSKLINIANLLRTFGVSIGFCNLEVNYTNRVDYENKRIFFTDLSLIRKQLIVIFNKYQKEEIKIDNLPLCGFSKDIIINRPEIISNYNKKQIEENEIEYSEGKISQINFKVKFDKCKKCIYLNKCVGVFPYFKEDHLIPFL